MSEIRRYGSTASIVASSAAGTTAGCIPYNMFAGGCVIVAATNGCTLINWMGGVSSAATPRQIYESGSAVTTALTVGIHPIPDACFASPFVFPIVTGGTTCAMTVGLKG